jgi:hypothetical protein
MVVLKNYTKQQGELRNQDKFFLTHIKTYLWQKTFLYKNMKKKVLLRYISYKNIKRNIFFFIVTKNLLVINTFADTGYTEIYDEAYFYKMLSDFWDVCCEKEHFETFLNTYCNYKTNCFLHNFLITLLHMDDPRRDVILDKFLNNIVTIKNKYTMLENYKKLCKKQLDESFENTQKLLETLPEMDFIEYGADHSCALLYYKINANLVNMRYFVSHLHKYLQNVVVNK